MFRAGDGNFGYPSVFEKNTHCKWYCKWELGNMDDDLNSIISVWQIQGGHVVHM